MPLTSYTAWDDNKRHTDLETSRKWFDWLERNTDFDHTGVFYCQDGLTVLPAYIKKAREAGLPALWLPPIPDVDTMADFFHNVTLVHALCYCAQFDDICPPWRTAEAFIGEGFSEVRVAPNHLFDPRDHIDK